MDKRTSRIGRGNQNEGWPKRTTRHRAFKPPSNPISSQVVPMNYSEQVLSPCIRQDAQLELKTKVTKQPKLFSSKSLSQLVPRSLFFKKRKDASNPTTTSATSSLTNEGHKLATARSFPSSAGAGFVVNSNAAMEYDEFDNYEDDSTIKGTPELNCRRSQQQSISTVGLPMHSSRNSITLLNDNCTLAQSSISPITNAKATVDEESGESTSKDKEADSKKKKNKANGTERCKPFKNTTLVLRDVKNSIGLRMKAKQESQAFVKLTNEIATPPTKLYSPFNIYTPDNCSKDSKSKRRLNLNGGSKKQADVSMTIADDSAANKRPVRDTPKRRAALQHKLHLMQGSKFAFDSPTGRLRETVKDVEHFQQYIEDISKTIRALSQPK